MPYPVVKPTLLCGPEPSALPAVFEQGYHVERAKSAPQLAPRDELVTDRFGTLQLAIGKPDTLLVRASATDLGSHLTSCKDSTSCSGGAQCIDKVCIAPAFPVAPANDAPVDNFTCYGVSSAKGAPAFQKIVGGLVEAADPFGGTVRYDVLKPAHLCAPVNKGGENAGAELHPSYLLCFKVKRTKLAPAQAAFVPLLAATSNTNFPDTRLAVSSPTELCVPARKALRPIPPLGSLIYGVSERHQLAPGTTDSFRLNVAAGESLTLVGTPDAPGLALTLEVVTPAFSVVGTATSAGAGVPVVLQTVPASTSGEYTLVVGGVAGGSGGYRLQAILNAAYLQSTDPLNSLASAYDLNAAFVPLGTVPVTDRAGVVASLPAAPAAAQVTSFFLAAGQSSAVAVRGMDPVSVTLFDGLGDAMALGAPGDGDIDEVIAGFVAPSSGTYYVLTTGAPATAYSLVVTRGAEFDRHATAFATAQKLDGTGAVLGAISRGTASGDWYEFVVNAGDDLVLTTNTPGGSSVDGLQLIDDVRPALKLYDAADNLVASAMGNAADGRNDVIAWTALSTGSYRVQVAPATPGSFGEYGLSVQGATGGPSPLTVVSSTPAAGAKLHRAPTSIIVVLDHAVRLDSVAAGDLVIDGQPATTASVLDDHTIAFAVSPVSSGAHAVGIANLVDLQGLSLAGTDFGFTVSRRSLPASLRPHAPQSSQCEDWALAVLIRGKTPRRSCQKLEAEDLPDSLWTR